MFSGTHGYIPGWDSMEKAVSALQKHLYGSITPTEYKFMVYNFEIVDGKFYMRSDKFDTAMQKLFFPLPMDINVTECRMQDVWKTKYEKTNRNPKRWNWTCTFIENIRVHQVRCGTLKLDFESGRFILI